MKKKIMLGLLGCLLAALLCGCGAKPAAKLPAAQELADQVLKSQTYSEEMFQVSETRASTLLDVEEEDYKELVMIMDASRTTSEVIAVLTAPDSAKADQAEQRMKDYLASLKEQYEDYRPEEMPKLEAAAVQRRATQVVLVVAPDQPAARQAVQKAWGN